jgi:hypothetical protein
MPIPPTLAPYSMPLVMAGCPAADGEIVGAGDTAILLPR